MNTTNLVIIIIYIILVAFITFFLTRFSYDRQLIFITILIIIAFCLERFLLYFFKEYFKDQWYYMNVITYKRKNAESITIPFILIGIIEYWLIQKIPIKKNMYKIRNK